MKPVISVVMSVYNGAKYLSDAIESILNQTYADFEFIIVDDASTDDSGEIIRSFANRDSRISVLTNVENLGLGSSLRCGMAAAEGVYIARMDADDISPSDRFQRQLDFLNSHPEIKVLGGDHILIDEKGKVIGNLKYPKTSMVIRWNMLLGNGLIVTNGATMMRKTFIEELGGYGDYKAAQDFELWSRTFEMDPLPIANLQEDILFYRQHGQANTVLLNSAQEKLAVATRQQSIRKLLGYTVSEEEVLAYRHTGEGYEHLEEGILSWIEIYARFVDRFSPPREDLAHIQRELMQRLSHYIYLNPFAHNKRGRMSFWQAAKILPLKTSIAVLKHKLGL